ncbi:hypothetical protein [Pseudomonas oryzihabitans]|uniref:hypothetical protein n=1 Tax=Pseudomonas oryzihabitans TaxID=47885 RepID=UPI00285C7C13|nr:hypothetical protein [Pseudomonas psychrotolerans]MDR6680174.1 hypothetical protein [Pseudomonas psychrotolerans]
MEAVPIGTFYRQLFPEGKVVQLIAPSQNTKGVYLRVAGAQPGHGWINLYASTTPPTAAGDIETRIIFAANGSARAGEKSQVNMPYPLFILAGFGMWVSSGSHLDGSAPDGSFGASWDFA